MDIKCRKNKTIRRSIEILVVLLVVVMNVLLLPQVQNTAREMSKQDAEEVDTSSYDEITDGLYAGCYVLYLENLKRLSGGKDYDVSTFLTDDSMEESKKEYTERNLKMYWRQAEQEFSYNREDIDYAVFSTADGLEFQESNTSVDLASYLTQDNQKSVLDGLKQTYGIIMVISFDENGMVDVSDVYTGQDDNDLLLKMMQSLTKNNYFYQYIQYDELMQNYQVTGPRNMTVVYGVPYTSPWAEYTYNNSMDMEYYYGRSGQNMISMFSFLAIGLMAVLCIYFRRKEAQREYENSWNRNSQAKSRKYPLLEAGIAGLIILLGSGRYILINFMWEINHGGRNQLRYLGCNGNQVETIIQILYGLVFLGIYLAFWACMSIVCEAGVYDIKTWIGDRSLIYRFVTWMSAQLRQSQEEFGKIDLSKAKWSKLMKFCVVNFLILAVICCFWFWGILLLIVYVIVMYRMLMKEWQKIQQDYGKLCEELEQLAQGDMNIAIPDSLGHFTEANEQIRQVRTGFSQAVAQEVKSQKMKTELITNVSHDLKTPLTAITTYIALLQEENITPQEQKEYIGVLERKSQRLRVLIEDLFDVSKANSDNLELELTQVDLTSLIHQVASELTEELEGQGLSLRYRVPEEKVLLSLDGQKAYRIYENLLGNVAKYALENTRVYIRIDKTEHNITTSIANVSKEELNFDEEEITERFTRGDASRNTEGSGLGLAIAKSFAEAMGGNLEISTEGDLFRVTIVWNR